MPPPRRGKVKDKGKKAWGPDAVARRGKVKDKGRKAWGT
jgi:hypothetical protein